MALTLANVKLVLSGTFGDLDAEDAHWGLIERGAYVTSSVTRTTAAVIFGDSPAKKHQAAATRHKTPVLGRDALVALLAGSSLEEVLRGPGRSAPPKDLDGWRVASAGRLAHRTRAQITALLEARGATVTARPSVRCDLLVLGTDPSYAAIAAQDAGVPFVVGDEAIELLGGAPIRSLVAAPVDVPSGGDRAALIAAQLDGLLEELAALDLGEPWEEELTLQVEPSGRAVVLLRDLGGTPTHDRIRQRFQKLGWHRGDGTVEFTRPLTFS